MRKCDTCEYEKVCEMPDFVRNNLKLCKTYTEKRVRTNADRIRAMSDEELAENTVQYDYEFQRYICGDGEEFYLRSNAIEHQLEWLKSPIE